MPSTDLVDNIQKTLDDLPAHRLFGRVTKILGLLVEVGGIERELSIGDRCVLMPRGARRCNQRKPRAIDADHNPRRATMTEFKKGDHVEWNSHGGTAEGKVVKKQTSDTEIKGHTVRASKDEPQYIVESDNGGKAAHKADALKKA